MGKLLGERIKELRDEKNLSQKALAERVGVTQQAVAKWEGGKSEPDSKTLITLADFFGCTVDYLIGKSDIKLPKMPLTIAAKMPEGWDELTPEAQKDVEEFIKFVRQKYGKKE